MDEPERGFHLRHFSFKEHIAAAVISPHFHIFICAHIPFFGEFNSGAPPHSSVGPIIPMDPRPRLKSADLIERMMLWECTYKKYVMKGFGGARNKEMLQIQKENENHRKSKEFGSNSETYHI